jgi:CheY-like chemotaxis protein
VVISDINLPLLDGWQLGRQLRAGLGDKAFLVAVTGSGRPGDEQRSREAGFDAHLSKPADPRTLLQLLCVSA